MKISVNWIKEFTDIKLPLDKLVEKIGAQLGAVEEVIDLGKKYQGIVVVKVVECVKHPNADKLNLCKVDDGRQAKHVRRDSDGLVQVVCGAPNVHAGMLAAWLPPGSTVPATIDKEPLILEAREIRGEVSNGMLASAHELAISEDHSGILEVDPLDAKPGDDFAKVYGLNDYVIDIENKMFTHRPDLFGILGVAREIAGINHQSFESPKWYLANKATPKTSDDPMLRVVNHIPKLVPRLMVQIVENVEAKRPSPLWLQTYLSRVGIRPINVIVDITNYVMYLTGQPLHAYDYDKLKLLSGDKPTIEARLANKGEKLSLLGGKEVTANESDIVIATDNVAIGLGGVMGGADTEVDENTKTIVLECANFDMYAIRRTAMEHGLFTDAVTRFNKGQSSLQCNHVLAFAVSETQKHAGGQASEFIHDNFPKRPEVGSLKVDPDFVNERLGLKLPISTMAKLLENVEFKLLKTSGKQLLITPPFWRTDIEIPEDIVEEIGRLYGYDHLPLELPKRDLTAAKPDAKLSFKSQIRSIMSQAGANEVLTYSFVHGNLLERVGQDRKLAFQLSNAISPDLQYYRMSLTPSLLDKIHPNIKTGHSEFALFEIGKAHIKGLQYKDEPDVPAEEERLALVFATDDKTVQSSYGGAPYYQALRFLAELLDNLGVNYAIEPYHEPKFAQGRQLLAPFEKSRTGFITINEQWVGIVGEFKPIVAKNLKLPTFSSGFELDLGRLQSLFETTSSYTPLSRYPSVQQDITLRVKTSVGFSQLFGLVKDNLAGRGFLVETKPLDIFQRDDDQTHKQVSFRIKIASYEKTLTDPEVAKILDEIAEAANDKLKAVRI